MTEEQKNRIYSIEYLRFGFIPFPLDEKLPLCVVCNKTFSNSSMKPSKLKKHLTKMHPDLKEKNITHFKELKKSYLAQPNLKGLFMTCSNQDFDGLKASYNISLLIAKSGKPHSIGEELIIPAIKEVLSTVLHKQPGSIVKKISLSNSTVQRRIDEMAQDVENILCVYLKSSFFSIQLDESTLPDNASLLLAYVRFIKDEKINQELLFAETLKTDTKGESIFLVFKEFFSTKKIPLTNILTVATDGAPAMIGRHKGFISYLKKLHPDVVSIHCVIHRQHLVAKNLSVRLHDSLNYVIQAVNKIKCSSLNTRLFNQLCIENEEVFNRLLLHTEVRWLSKGNCLNRFWEIFNSVIEFLISKGDILHARLNESKSDIAYISDLFNKFNEVNLKLQGEDLNLIKAKSILSGFVEKLLLYKQNLGRSEFMFFPNLETAKPNEDDIFIYCDHLEALYHDFNVRFKDIFTLSIPDWVLNPFLIDSAEDSLQLQEELMDIRNDYELKYKFKNGYQQFWLQKKISEKYPGVWKIVEKLILAFPSSYLVERGFSAVTNLLTKKRNRLQTVERGDLRLLLTKIQPRVKDLLESHQIHPSH
ncbi:SCAN domain-containing protein 3 [Dictyocoela muelleri]|nr:SCAN domain-containing protein 3 [Dictyocoela muelleri]